MCECVRVRARVCGFVYVKVGQSVGEPIQCFKSYLTNFDI